MESERESCVICKPQSSFLCAYATARTIPLLCPNPYPPLLLNRKFLLPFAGILRSLLRWRIRKDRSGMIRVSKGCKSWRARLFPAPLVISNNSRRRPVRLPRILAGRFWDRHAGQCRQRSTLSPGTAENVRLLRGYWRNCRRSRIVKRQSEWLRLPSTLLRIRIYIVYTISFSSSSDSTVKSASSAASFGV